jgi:hypothetical protein
LLWQLERIERIHAVAHALMKEFGDEAYAEARRREREANRDERARDWRRVALVVARRTCRGVGRAAMTRSPFPGLGSVDSPTRIVPERGPTYRIQFVCGTVDRGPTNLTEKQIEVADAPAAIIAAASIKWPPRTIGVRILDREGHEVFARQRAQRK